MFKEIIVTEEDIERFRKFANKRLRLALNKEIGFKRILINLFSWIVTVVGVILIIIMLLEASSTRWHWPTALITSSIFLLFTSAFISNGKNIEKKHGASLALGRSTLEIDGSGIEYVSSLRSGSFKWQALQEVVIHEQNIYLFLDYLVAHIIPSSAFNSHVEAVEFAVKIEELHRKTLHQEAQ